MLYNKVVGNNKDFNQKSAIVHRYSSFPDPLTPKGGFWMVVLMSVYCSVLPRCFGPGVVKIKKTLNACSAHRT